MTCFWLLQVPGGADAEVGAGVQSALPIEALQQGKLS